MMTPEEKREYRHKMYIKHRDKRLAYCHKYYQEHKDEISFKQKNAYRKKCGLKPLKKKEE